MFDLFLHIPFSYPVCRRAEGVKDRGCPLWKPLPSGGSNTRVRTWSIDTRNGNGVTKGSHSSVSRSSVLLCPFVHPESSRVSKRS